MYYLGVELASAMDVLDLEVQLPELGVDIEHSCRRCPRNSEIAPKAVQQAASRPA